MSNQFPNLPSLPPAFSNQMVDLLTRLEDIEITEDIADDEETLVHHVVLIDQEDKLQQRIDRIEVFIVAELENSIKVTSKKNNDHIYIDKTRIIDDLGPATPEQFEEFGVNPPEPEPTPDYQTGTYIANTNHGIFLAEIDRVGDTYLIHDAGGSSVEPLTPELWEALDEFSGPEDPNDIDHYTTGNYTAEPGLYYVEKTQRLIEVVPYGGYSYYRFINDAQLTKLHAPLVKDLQRVETDTFEVNAIMVMPETHNIGDGTANIEETNNLNNDEQAPTGCCQAAPREE